MNQKPQTIEMSFEIKKYLKNLSMQEKIKIKPLENFTL